MVEIGVKVCGNFRNYTSFVSLNRKVVHLSGLCLGFVVEPPSLLRPIEFARWISSSLRAASLR
jgi:hypothetical protein